MAKLKPWYHVVTPREDLREGKPLDASEFAVHLDHIRDNRAHADYVNPQRFFDRTYLTTSLKDLSSQVVRRLSGEKVETSAVFNMATQFGGGKTHSLTALYHLAKGGENSLKWKGVDAIVQKARVKTVPNADVAVFVGTEFDVLEGRGGNGEPIRITPWGEIAWQLGGKNCFEAVASHDEKGIAPGGDVIRKMLPEGPVLILMDELLNYVSRARKTGIASQLYDFLQNLSEEARGRDNMVLCVSIPASELEMTPEDQRDYDSYKKLLDRVGKAVSMSSDIEVTEIIRRRLFEWAGHDFADDAKKTISAYADWASENAAAIGGLGGENPAELFKASYPFHPSVLSVFERKWQSSARFQRTRGVLRLLALWVSHAWQEEHRKAANEPLITLGSAPLENQTFRDAVFEQLGSDQLSIPVTTDIVGKKDAHAIRLDSEAIDEIKKGRLHQKVATIIFFESNGGQSQNKAEASEADIRSALGGPDINLTNIETVLEGLAGSCYYLRWDRNRYRFGLQANLNQVLVQRRNSISAKDVDEQIKKVISDVFNKRPRGIELPKCFPSQSNDIPDRPQLTFVVLGPAYPFGCKDTAPFIEKLIRECGTSGRVSKTALIVCVLDSIESIQASAKDFLAWQEIEEDEDTVKQLDESQKRSLGQNLERSKKVLNESVWRSYRHVFLLGKDNKITPKDLGQITSSMAPSLPEMVLNDLQQTDQVTEQVAARKLLQYWPPALQEWSTKGVRDAFFASPALPRLLNPESIRKTIADGVVSKTLGYARKDSSGKLKLDRFGESIAESEIEISDDVFILKGEEAQKLLEPPRLHTISILPERVSIWLGEKASVSCKGNDQYGQPFEIKEIDWKGQGVEISDAGIITAPTEPGSYKVSAQSGGHFAEAVVNVMQTQAAGAGAEPAKPGEKRISWSGDVPPQKWMNFYTKVLSRFASNPGLKLAVNFQVKGEKLDGKADEVKSALRDLGLSENIEE